MNHHHILERLLGQGPIRRQDHPDLGTTIDRAIRNGAVTAVLPGVYLPTSEVDGQDLLLRAAMAWEPRAVVTGRLAAVRQFWPDLDHDLIELAVPTQRSVRSHRFRLTRRAVPVALVGRYRGVRFTRPELTAVDLCDELGPEVINRALRSRKVTPAQLQRALLLCPQRKGNVARRADVLDSVGNPWSYAERLTHQRLRGARITGWRGNPKLRVRGQVYYPDVLFDAVKLVIEVDGLHHARDDEVYQGDVWRMNDFSLDRYAMLRYTLKDVELRPATMIEEIQDLKRTLERERGLR